jgi:hypothetical protein
VGDEAKKFVCVFETAMGFRIEKRRDCGGYWIDLATYPLSISQSVIISHSVSRSVDGEGELVEEGGWNKGEHFLPSFFFFLCL